MKKESEAILLRIFIEGSDEYKGKKLCLYIVEMLKKEGIAWATVLRGIEGYEKSSNVHITSILRLLTDLSIIIGVVDLKENIDEIKPMLNKIIKGGLITEEKVKILFYDGNKK